MKQMRLDLEEVPAREEEVARVERMLQLPPECSICRRRHGPEVRHECE